MGSRKLDERKLQRRKTLAKAITEDFGSKHVNIHVYIYIYIHMPIQWRKRMKHDFTFEDLDRIKKQVDFTSRNWTTNSTTLGHQEKHIDMIYLFGWWPKKSTEKPIIPSQYGMILSPLLQILETRAFSVLMYCKFRCRYGYSKVLPSCKLLSNPA